MGYFWSMGISFRDKQIAENCQAELKEIKLSDGRLVNFSCYILPQTDFDIEPNYVLEIYPEEMEIDGRRKNLEYPFFDEIRNQLLQFVRDLKLNFEIAFCECEGADRVTHTNLINCINENGIEEYLSSENIDIYLNPENPYPKRYFDGLILSKNEYERLKIKYPEFKKFKENYLWLPIQTAANSY
ncbi:hypothetical protein [Flavobacterium stagni]|uniref:Uncharacterized protein n=1 Tax=Flavobacterium stagni TaxID=2506421 RepID=A0A4V1N226_9FLAO|nr:hypothetical protein [Flavobacterium stagni]RXR20251.1 hypothetical protein EQG61_12585 [Flavobacterium stagni]